MISTIKGKPYIKRVILSAIFFLSLSFAVKYFKGKGSNGEVEETESYLNSNRRNLLNIELRGLCITNHKYEKIGKFGGSFLSLPFLKELIEKAASDSNIDGIYIDWGGACVKMSQLLDLKNILLKFKEESGKPIFFYASGLSEGAFVLAEVADEIHMHPSGQILLGLWYPSVHAKNLLDKFGFKNRFYRSGEHKVLQEPLSTDSLHPYERETRLKILTYLHKIFLKSVVNRVVDSVRDKFLEKLETTPLLSSQEAKKNGMIDKLVFLHEGVSELLNKKSIASEPETQLSDETNDEKNDETSRELDVRYIDLEQYASSYRGYNPIIEDRGFFKRFFSILSRLELEKKQKEMEESIIRDQMVKKIAVITLSGIIVSGEENSLKEITDRGTIKLLKECEKNDSISAVILIINSNGGSAIASENIGHAIKNLSEEKPVSTFVNGYCFSGGYWLAASCNKIVVAPSALTGSIGVLIQKREYKDALKKQEVNVEEVSVGRPYNPIFSPYHTNNEEDDAVIQYLLDEAREGFKRVVAEGRGMSEEEVEPLAQGDVWYPEQMKELGLIDKIGDLEEAINLCISMSNEKTGLNTSREDYEVVYINTNYGGSSMKDDLLSGCLEQLDSQNPELLYLEDIDGVWDNRVNAISRKLNKLLRIFGFMLSIAEYIS